MWKIFSALALLATLATACAHSGDMPAERNASSGYVR